MAFRPIVRGIHRGGRIAEDRSRCRPRAFGACPTLAVLLVLAAAVAVPLLEPAEPPRTRADVPMGSLVTAVDFGPAGDRIYSNPKTSGPTIVRIEDGVVWRDRSVATDRFATLAADPSGRYLAVALDSGPIELRDPDTLALLRALPGHDARAQDLAISADGERLISISSDGACRAWTIAEGRLDWEFLEASGLSRCALSPNGRWAALASRAGEIAILDAGTGAEVARRDAHGRGRASLAVAFSPDGRILASVGLDNRLRTWDASAGWSPRLAVPMPGGLSNCLAISPDGRSVATGHNDGRVRFWGLDRGDLRSETALDPLQLGSLSYAPDGRSVAVAIGSTVALIEVPEAA